MPLFSIIVTALNAEETIEETITSVLMQTCEEYEVIVKDGLSKDRTLERIPSDARIRVYSQLDTSLYDGMNQGIQVARGQYLCFLNCGDTFYDNTVLERVARYVRASSEPTFFYGNYETKGSFIQTPKVTTQYSLYRNPLCHQTMFIPRVLFEQLGMYRNDFRILADYEFTVHAFTVGVPFVNMGITVCRYLGDGVSTQAKYRKQIDAEYKWVRTTYFAKSERKKYELKIAMTLLWLRVYLSSDKAPAFARNVYRKLANWSKGGAWR